MEKKQKKTDTEPTEETMTLQEAVRELKQSLQTLATREDISQLREEMEKMQASFCTRIDKLESSVFELENERDQLRQEVAKITEKNTDLQQQLSLHSRTTADLKRSLNEQEQYGRLWNLRVYGVKEAHGEVVRDYIDKCRNIFSKTLGVPTSDGDTETAHRVGKPVSQDNGGRPRPIIVRFFSRSHRGKILSVRKQLKGAGVSIGEDLTLNNYKLLQQVSKHSATLSAWSYNGRVTAKLKNGKTVKVDINDDINKVLRSNM